MRSSYPKEDVHLLLTDITGKVSPLSTEEREREIQGGRHYSEMLPVEQRPSKAYEEAYQQAVKLFAADSAEAVGRLALQLHEAYPQKLVLLSLLRGGLPVGILLKRYFRRYLGRELPHYGISLLRGRGIDQVAMKHILSQHEGESLVFVDGWTGKGAIFRQLQQALEDFPSVKPRLAVVADPAQVAEFYGSGEDILLASACLNATVSGLLSRSFLRADILAPTDYHGAVYYEDLEDADVSLDFLAQVEAEFSPTPLPLSSTERDFGGGWKEANEIAEDYGIEDINLVKPGIGEATRVLLRRVPWKLLVAEGEHPALAHILQLAQERAVPVEYRAMKHYRAVGLIRKMEDV